MSIYNTLKYIVNKFELNNRIVLNIVNNWNSDLIKNSLYKLVEIDKISENHQYNKESQEILKNFIVPKLQKFWAIIPQNNYEGKEKYIE